MRLWDGGDARAVIAGGILVAQGLAACAPVAKGRSPGGGESSGGAATVGVDGTPATGTGSGDARLGLQCPEKALTDSPRAEKNADLAVLAGVTRLNGDLDITGIVTDLGALKCLTHVVGLLSIAGAPALTRAEFPSLRHVDRIHASNDAKLTSLSFPSLRSIGPGAGNSVLLSRLPELTAVRLGQLATLPGSLYLHELAISADSLLSLDFGSLTEIRGNLDILHVSNLLDASAFATLSHVSGWMTIDGNASLASVSGFGSLRLDGPLQITNDVALPTCEARALASRLKPPGSPVTLSNNKPDGC